MELVKLLFFLLLITVNTLSYGQKLIIGVMRTEPPYSSVVPNSDVYYGFCIDLMDEICSRLQYTCKYRETKFGKQEEDLRKGLFDMTFFPSPITETDDEDYMYTLPYIPSTVQFMTLANSIIYSIKELKDKKVGVIQASSFKDNFLDQYTAQTNIMEYDDTTGLLTALIAHQIDAMLVNSSVAKYLIINVGNLKSLGKPVQFGMGYGISLMKKNAALVKKINKVLLQIEADGTYARIYHKYFGY
jgi:ABC-type amino acid transport substrate-binding protein